MSSERKTILPPLLLHAAGSCSHCCTNSSRTLSWRLLPYSSIGTTRHPSGERCVAQVAYERTCVEPAPEHEVVPRQLLVLALEQRVSVEVFQPRLHVRRDGLGGDVQ